MIVFVFFFAKVYGFEIIEIDVNFQPFNVTTLFSEVHNKNNALAIQPNQVNCYPQLTL